jgi:CheY-like chemotaxis protein
VTDGTHPTRILVLDDDATMRSLFAIAFRHFPVQLMLAADASEAKLYLQNNLPDVILADLWLGKENGLEVAEMLSVQTGQRVPILVISAEDGAQVQDYVTSHRCLAYLRKPINLQTFGRDVFSCLAGFRDNVIGQPTSTLDLAATTNQLAITLLANALRTAETLSSHSNTDLIGDDSLVHTAHNWIGASGIGCFPKIDTEARELERLARTKDCSHLPRMRQLLTNIKTELQRSSPEAAAV